MAIIKLTKEESSFIGINVYEDVYAKREPKDLMVHVRDIWHELTNPDESKLNWHLDEVQKFIDLFRKYSNLYKQKGTTGGNAALTNSILQKLESCKK